MIGKETIFNYRYSLAIGIFLSCGYEEIIFNYNS